MTEPKKPSAVVAQRVRDLRSKRQWSVRQLAERCAEIGATDITDNVIENIERRRSVDATRRGRDITVDQLMVLALALEVSPTVLLLPSANVPYALTSTLTPSARHIADWLHDVYPATFGNAGSLAALIPVTKDSQRRAVQDFLEHVPYAKDPFETLSELAEGQLDELTEVEEAISRSKAEIREEIKLDLRDEFQQMLDAALRDYEYPPADGEDPTGGDSDDE